MFKNIAEFFIKNSKLTFVLVFVSLGIGISSYFALPKQYNPTIVVPAFSIQIQGYWLNAEEINKTIVTPTENLIMEIEWIDEVYWYSYDNMWAVMAKFKVWVTSENAKIRLNQKLNENLNQKPSEIWNPIIKAIDPEDLPQITYAISYNWNKLDKNNTQIYLRQVANIIKDEIKKVENITTMEIIWGLKKDIYVNLDLDKIKAKNTDILQVYEVLKKYNLNSPSWDLNTKDEKIFININWKIQDIKDLENIIISNINWNELYLKDIASIWFWIKDIKSNIIYTNKNKNYDSILIGFWKKKWSNSVNISNDIIKKINSINLPKDISLEIIQNEGETAHHATNMLLWNLFQSMIIVFFVLALYLWFKDAFNTAVSIPLSLWLVFLIAVLIWDNINKITLFALILVLWMIVDNSTVVVENIARHLKERAINKKTKLQAVLDWTQEVWIWVIMATITRLIAFWAMFAVTWMMWEYMWPIPKYSIIALILSLIVALTINPWISYLSAKDVTQKDTKINIKENKYDIRKFYLNFMRKFLNEDKKSYKNRRIFKFTFWLSLLLIMIVPIYLWIFKARMLPKSNQNQIYVWIDAPRWTNYEKMVEIDNYFKNFFINKAPNKNLDIVDNITSSIWTAFMWDFANLFRWGSQRIFENQISARINFINKDDYKKNIGKARITSEIYTFTIREDFRKYMFEKYPDVKIKLLEDPPGPPVESTFMLKIKGDWTKENIDYLTIKTYKEIEKISKKYSLEDLWLSYDSTYKKIDINIDNNSASKAWISTYQIINTLWIIYNDVNIWIVKNNNSFDTNSIILWVKKEQKINISDIKNISFTNNNGEKISLDTIAEIKYSFVSPMIKTDKRQFTNTIFAEMWNESLIYPIIKLIFDFKDKNFLWNEYKLISWNPYEIKIKWLNDWKEYILEWWWEWKLTVDTFRDLWVAMWISLLAIYFLLVWQFASFSIAWVIMITFLLSFFWVFPVFTILYLLNNEFFSATSMIWIITLWWIVVWNAIILIEYLNVLKKNWIWIWEALLKAWYVRFAPIILTSLTTVFWAATIIWDPVWSWLAWTIIWWLFVSSILTLIVIPIFYYDSQKKYWK